MRVSKCSCNLFQSQEEVPSIPAPFPIDGLRIFFQSAELRSQGGYWGEVSGAIAHKLIKKGLNTISDRNKVESLVGLNINWFGDCPVSHPSFHGNVPDTFKNAKGWYERDIGGEKHMKIIIGIPKVS